MQSLIQLREHRVRRNPPRGPPRRSGGPGPAGDTRPAGNRGVGWRLRLCCSGVTPLCLCVAGARALRALVGAALAGVLCVVAVATAAGASLPLRYAGTGNRTLAVVKVGSDSVVRWTASGGSFSMVAGRLKVSGKAKSGQTFVTRGTYRRVQVRAKGKWTVTFTALPVPKK
jgi:hypothetical protein